MRIEVAEARWLPLDEAPRLLAYGGEREMAAKARDRIAGMSEPVNVADYERLAEEQVDPKVWCYFAGGAGDEVTLRANAAAFGRWRFRPRVLVDVARGLGRDAPCSGRRVSMPLLVAPFAYAAAARPGRRGRHRARGRGRRDALLRLDDHARARTPRSRRPRRRRAALAPALRPPATAARRSTISRRRASCGYSAARAHGRHAAARAARARPAARLPDPVRPAAARTSAAREPRTRPRWRSTFRIYAVAHVARPRVDRAEGRGCRCAEGRADGARTRALAVEHGAAAVIVSNHGGRQLDGVAASARRAARGGGGRRRPRARSTSTAASAAARDVLKALALGARAALVGRAPCLSGSRSPARPACATCSSSCATRSRSRLALLGCTSPGARWLAPTFEPAVPYDSSRIRL